MRKSFIESVKRASVDFSRSTNLVAKYAIVGRDHVDSLRAFLKDVDWPWKCHGDRLPEMPEVIHVLNIKIFVAPWTTGITILPDVATCETFACATNVRRP